MRKIILLIIVLALFTGGCTEKEQTTNHSNVFDAKQVKIGEQVAEMEIIALEVFEYAARVEFSGEATVTGEYKHHEDDEFLAGEIAFKVADESMKQLPKMTDDERYLWFVFANKETAEAAFGPPGSEGQATVIIQQYTINYAPTEVWNTAKLIKVIEKNRSGD